MLAEIIKNSKIDLNSLATFVRSNQIEPDWMTMQVPYGTFAHVPPNQKLTGQVAT